MIKFLERKVERHEDVIEKLEKKLKTPNDVINVSDKHVDVEEALSSSSTSSYTREKRPARLFPAHILHK